MAEPGKGRGVGRGAALLAMLKKSSEVGADSSEEVTPETPPPIPMNRPRGRASLMDMVQKTASSVTPGTPEPTKSSSGIAPPVAAPRIALGRASLMTMKLSTPGREPELASTVAPMRAPAPISESKPKSAPPPRAAESAISRSTMSGDGQGVTGSLRAMALGTKSYTSTGSSGPISRMGTDGVPLGIMSNYIDISINPDKGIFRYEAKFDPETDSPQLRNAMLNQHLDKLGKTKVFDGIILFLPKRLESDKTILKSVRRDGTQITITLLYQYQQAPKDSIQFFNILLNKVLSALKLVRINRNYFNPRCAHRIDQHRMELWPGYVTAIEEMEGGLKLNIDASHRLMRTDTVRDLIKNILTQKGTGNFKDAVIKEMMGMSVLTRYNNQTYRVDDIDWDKNPAYKFDYKGKLISIAEYFHSHWNLSIKDMKQPLILHRAKKKLSQGGVKEEEILLVPELCYLTGMTDAIRSNFKIMRDLAQVTQVVPEKRRQVIRHFIQDVNNEPAAKELLENWGLRLENDLVKLKGRILPRETLFFGNERQSEVNDKADWGVPATKGAVLRTPNMQKWCIVYVERDEKIIIEFIRTLNMVAKTIGMQIGEAKRIALRNDSAQNYVKEIREAINPQLEMVVAVCPTNRNDRYAAIKKLCCVESPIKSQVIVTKTISQDNKLKSVTEKIALQMNCKLGGALWALKVPFNDVMICGIDVFHPPAGSGTKGSVAGFVASIDQRYTSWYSKVCFQMGNQEIIDLLKICLVSALGAYKKRRGEYPARIIIYRDGVGDGQLATVGQYEVEQLRSAFPLVEKLYAPKLSVIVVQKRINTRVMAQKGTRLENPPPGTIVDSCVTRRNYADFFLVPQTARQGTVTPTHYIVLVDECSTKIDHLQRLSYKLCHLYYNWPGTIRVPAPCQYAHKLAYLVGQSIQSEPNECLSDSLYYL